MHLPNKSGVYAIVNLLNRKLYVGSSLSIRKRCRTHLRYLLSSSHWSKHLQSAWNEYGTSKFEFKVLELCKAKNLVIKEQMWIDKTESANPKFGYNAKPKADSSLGWKHSEESRKKISEAGTGRKHSVESRMKISESNKGLKRPRASVLRIAMLKTGSRHTEETKKQMRESSRKFWDSARGALARRNMSLRRRSQNASNCRQKAKSTRSTSVLD